MHQRISKNNIEDEEENAKPLYNSYIFSAINPPQLEMKKLLFHSLLSSLRPQPTFSTIIICNLVGILLYRRWVIN